MSYETEKKKMEAAADKIAKGIAGKKIASISMPVGYPGHYSYVEIVLEDGTKLSVNSGGGGCCECDPEGIGWGVGVDLREAE